MEEEQDSIPVQPDPKKLKMSSTEEEDTTTNNKPTRYKRRKIAILFAYCGVGYQGMQKNPGAKTIEGEMEEALFLAGAVPEGDRGCPKRFDFARSARTDKGVSAVGQVISGRFYVDPEGLVERINGVLPDQIRVFGFKRVTNSFNAKKFCDRRRYVYLIPVFALDPNSHPDRESVLASLGSGNELAKCLECSERGRKVEGVMGKRSFEPRDGEFQGTAGSNISSNSGTALLDTGIIITSNANIGNHQDIDNVTDSGILEDAGIAVGISSNSESAMCETEKREETTVIDDNDVNGDNLNGKDEAIDPNIPQNLGVGLVTETDISPNSESTILEIENNINNIECDPGTVKVDDMDIPENVGSEKENKIEVSSINEVGEISGAISKDIGNGNMEPEQLNGNTVKNDVDVDGKEGVMKGTGFCYGDEEKERFNRILNRYVGTHNFHNFTTRMKAEDPSAKRFIISFEANTVVNVDGIDFVKCEVVGQSFMLHQIRKMIGVAVAIMRNCADESLIEMAFQQDLNITVPTAPEVGLYLDECFFTSYNQKWNDTHEEVSMKAYENEAEEFKMKHIYSHIASTEHKEGTVALWLHSLNHRNYPDLRSGCKDGNPEEKGDKPL